MACVFCGRCSDQLLCDECDDLRTMIAEGTCTVLQVGRLLYPLRHLPPIERAS